MGARRTPRGSPVKLSDEARERVLRAARGAAFAASCGGGGCCAEAERAATVDAYKWLLLRSLGRALRKERTQSGHEHAASIFGRNLQLLLSQPPARGRRVLGVDPWLRSGHKLTAVSAAGDVLEVGRVRHRRIAQWLRRAALDA